MKLSDRILSLPFTRRRALGTLGAGVLGVFGMRQALAAGPVFPIRQRTGTQFLEDAAGKPFLLQGDTAWSLITQLKRPDVLRYLDDRAARGFNAVVVMLINHQFCTNAPANAYGQQPFLTPGDFSTYNPKYFAHAAWVVAQAAARGILVVLAPAYLGFQGSGQGWYAEMAANGVTKLTKYGRFLGARFRANTNILWLNGGDYVPPDKSIVNAVANGIRSTNPAALQTAHCTLELSALDAYRGQPWLNLNTAYTHNAPYIECAREYQQPERMPYFLAESYYEGEHNTSQLQLRAQAYQALLSGAAGQVFGNNPVWHFDGPGIIPINQKWVPALASRGARSMGYLASLFSSLEWWRLKPDLNNTFLKSGTGVNIGRAVASIADDGSFGVGYVPNVRQIGFNLSKMAGPNISAQWFDPSNGTYTAAPGSPFPAAGSQFLNPSHLNASGASDWVLILRSVA